MEGRTIVRPNVKQMQLIETLARRLQWRAGQLSGQTGNVPMAVGV